MEFYKEIVQTLVQNGIFCTTEPIFAHDKATSGSAKGYAGLTLINACKRGCATETPISIISVPANALTLEEAKAQGSALMEFLQTHKAVIITEDRWRKSGILMKTRLLSHLGVFRSVYARDCEVRRINKDEADAFLKLNHSYGGAKCKYCYGLFLKRVRSKDYIKSANSLSEGELLAAAEFSNARRWQKGTICIRSYEWIRYASLPELRISGGMGKILKHFISEVHPDDIMSYADMEWSDGDVYRKLGFTQENIRPPVIFSINKETWIRTPLQYGQENATQTAFLQNVGSAKYRLKLTDY